MKKMTLAIIRFYRRHISLFLPRVCRFYPTCSKYALEAIQKYGVFKGGRLVLGRILRCHPFSKGGYDPVR